MRYLYWLGLIIAAFIAIFFAPNTYYLYIIGTIAITTLVGVGLNISTGLSGQVSIGHAGFFAIGAYTGSLLMTKLQWNFWLATVHSRYQSLSYTGFRCTDYGCGL